MRRAFFLTFLCCLFSAEITSWSDSKQFFNLLVVPEDEQPAVLRSEIESSLQEVVLDDEESKNSFYLLLVSDDEWAQGKKLYRKDIESFNFEYCTEQRFVSGFSGFPQLDSSVLSKDDKKAVKKYKKLIAQHYETPWYLRHISREIGYGVFADADIEEGQMIAEYTGKILAVNAMVNMDMNYCWVLSPPQQHGAMTKLFYVDARPMGNFTRFINHSFYPNVKPLVVYSDDAWHMVYVAARKIKKDEQLLVNYGLGYWTPKSTRPVEMGLIQG